MNYETIYHVTTEGDCEGRTTATLGYATGAVAHIEDFYADQKTYKLTITPIKVLKVKIDSAKERRDLLEQRDKLQKEIDRINDKLIPI